MLLVIDYCLIPARIHTKLWLVIQLEVYKSMPRFSLISEEPCVLLVLLLVWLWYQTFITFQETRILVQDTSQYSWHMTSSIPIRHPILLWRPSKRWPGWSSVSPFVWHGVGAPRRLDMKIGFSRRVIPPHNFCYRSSGLSTFSAPPQS